MRLGLHALGIGNGATRAVIDAVAVAAEKSGFATLWSGEHVVMVDESASREPYSDDGRIAVPAETDWIDPLIGLSFAAAVTSTIRIATGVLLLPEHNPVLVAKQAATLDTLSGGRLTLGIGIGCRARSSTRSASLSSAGVRARASTSMPCAPCGATMWPRSTANSFASMRCG
jgi:alkanesulfonate monooxygenase SsuD/methylene tetrahydromethanopterin reductase-like flavin-dependent oxidoreductase (luciferase family)